MKRRGFLQLSAAGAVAAAIPAWVVEPTREAGALAYPELLGIVRDDGIIRRIGAAYRSSHPNEETVSDLYAVLSEEADMAPGRDVRQNLARLVVRDFERSDTVRLDGWIVARTEARQCALYSLLYS